MKRGTIWTIMVLATGALFLIAYYLLPLWWAGTIADWVANSNTWVTGIPLGAGLFLIAAGGSLISLKIADGDGTVRGVLRARREAKSARTAADKLAIEHGRTRDGTSGGWKHYLRLASTIITGASLAALLLTIAIAIGFTEPLREARALWRQDSSGVLASTLIGVLLGILLISGFVNLRQRRRVSKLESVARSTTMTAKRPSTRPPSTRAGSTPDHVQPTGSDSTSSDPVDKHE